MRTLHGSWVWIGAFGLAAGQVAGCNVLSNDCENSGTCNGGGSSSGASTVGGEGGVDAGGSSSGKGGTNAGTSGIGGNVGGGASGGDGGGGDGGAGGAGGSLTGPCGGDCPSETPVCDEPNDTCVECLEETDCAAGPENKCDTVAKTCVACLAPADCPSAIASRCEGGACGECESNTDCEHIAGKGVCDAGTCVQCTGTDYASCGMDAGTPLVCDSLARTCTTNKQASAGLCQPCVSDAQCSAGKLCVQEEFGAPAADVGYFCFWNEGDTTNGAPANCGTGRPYVDTIADQVSIDGTTADICGLAVSTCVARNEFRSKDCATTALPDDTKCGFAPGEDAKCGLFNVGIYRCTMTCGSDDDCPNGFACDIGADPPVCEL